jgi:multidrug efflux pump subunit AcrA (membrane-fusion protein)
MMKKWLILLLGASLLAGCGQGGAAEPSTVEELPVVREAGGGVVAEAVIEPLRWSELLFTTGGTVAEVLVSPGDEVSEGDLLVQLDSTDVALAVQEAEAALAAAKAQLAQVRAGPRPEEVAEAESELSDAEATLAQAVAQCDQLAAGATEAETSAAQAAVAGAETEQRAALQQRDQAYQQKDQEVRKQADYQLYAANEALAAAQARLEAAQGGAAARLREARAGVQAATAHRDVAQAGLDLLQAGATPEEIAVSEAAVQQAEAALAMAKAALERTQIRAPFPGTVTRVDVEVGETVSPGEVVVVLAILDQLQARTVDLTELDVARLVEGQAAAVTVDALPGMELKGQVARIDLRAVDYRGDVTYPVYVEVEEDAVGLRWGMTALVEIEAD